MVVLRKKVSFYRESKHPIGGDGTGRAFRTRHMKPGQGDHKRTFESVGTLSGVPSLHNLRVGWVGPGTGGSVTHPGDPDFLLHPPLPTRLQSKIKINSI